MDPSVIESIARWPDVPAVHGWLSLDRNGNWRLHPQGDAGKGGAGTSITNTTILAFIGRNYARDDEGRWFFQNGPQRVYVRLDAAPFILRTTDGGAGLETHTGIAAGKVRHWWLDEQGRLYASTDAGPGMVAGRDLPQLMDAMRLPDGGAALEAVAALPQGRQLPVCLPADSAPVPLDHIAAADVPTRLGFILSEGNAGGNAGGTAGGTTNDNAGIATDA
jgi:hypothetical protein